MMYIGTVARNTNHPVRPILFEHGTMKLISMDKRVGRPRLNWGNEIMDHVVKATSCYETVIGNKNHWRKVVRDYGAHAII